MKKIALIPAYRPSPEMIELIKALKKDSFYIIIVNDGSGSDCEYLFEQALDYAEILRHDKNRGKGAALKTGLSFINQYCKPPFIVVTADADGQHLAKDIIKVCEESEKHINALVLGSRKLNPAVPLRSRIGNTVTRFVFAISSGKKLYDTQTGLRAFSDKLLPKMLHINGERYEYEMNMLMELAKDGTDFVEVPIETVYTDKKNSTSHFRTIRDSYRIYKEILKFSASSFISFCADYLLFCLFINLTGLLAFSNISARVCSSVLNYSINRKLVFKNDSSLLLSAVKYFALAAVVLLLNTLLVKSLCGLGFSAYIAKIIAESILFVFSWLIQRTLIFRKVQSSSK